MDRHRDISAYARFTNNEFYRQNRSMLKELIDTILKAHRGEYPPLDLQAELLSHIIAADSARRKYSRWKDRFGIALGALARSGAAPERLKRAQGRMEDMQVGAEAAKLLGSQLRSIGDGIAWRFLDYDRAALRLLAEHEHVSVPQLGPGLYAELAAMGRLANEGQQVLLNSTTNFLRVGDVTTRDPHTGRIGLVEVKAGRRQTLRTQRQGKFLELVQDGLETGSHSLVGVRMTKLMCRSSLKTHILSVEAAMAEAERKRGSSRLFGDYLSVAVFAMRRVVGELSEEDQADLRQTVMQRCLSVGRRKTDFLLPPMVNIFRAMRFLPILAPYSVFPINPDRRFDLFCGDIAVFSLLNVSGLARWLEKRDWRVEVLMPKDEPDFNAPLLHVPVMSVRKGRKGVEVGMDTLLVAAAEFWQAESVEEWVQTALREGVPGAGFYQPVFPNAGRYAWD